MATTDFRSVEEYLASFPADLQDILRQVRETIHAVVPNVGEKISYQLPTVTMDGKPLMYYSGWKKHISVYPLPPMDDQLAQEVEQYLSGKGTLKFPLAKPIPYDVIRRVAEAFVASRSAK
jgi:uncharacterized protein YdhG (YjbR/CyaY superfamily)